MSKYLSVAGLALSLLICVLILPSSVVAEVTTSPTPTASPTPSAYASPAPSPISSPSPVPSLTPVPTATASPLPSSASTPTETSTPSAPVIEKTYSATSISSGGGFQSKYTYRAASFGTPTGCQTITQPGTYTILQDISSGPTCITVDADNVVLDGGNFTLSGENRADHYGIEIKAHTGVEIKNFKINNFTAGIYIDSGASAIKLHDNSFTGNTYGVIFRQSSGHTISNNTSSNNTDTGLYLDHISNSTISDNTTVSNNNVGIYILGGTKNTLTNNTITGSDRGLLFNESSGNTANKNTVNNNNYAIALEVGSSDNTLTDNISDNNTTAISIAGEHNTIKNQTIDHSSDVALRFFESDSINNTVENTTITNTSVEGYDLKFDDALDNADAAGVSGNTFINTPIKRYYVNSTGGMPVFQNNMGRLEFADGISGSGDMSSDIVITSNSIYINPQQTALHKKALLTFFALPPKAADLIKKDHAPCTECSFVENSGDGKVTITTPNASGLYSVGWSAPTSGTVSISDTSISGVNRNIDSLGNGGGFVAPQVINPTDAQPVGGQITPLQHSGSHSILVSSPAHVSTPISATVHDSVDLLSIWGADIDNHTADYNHDGRVDILDLDILRASALRK